MSRATINRQPPTPLGDLREQAARSATNLKVDREKGIIYGVKITGFDSSHGYSYDPTGIDPTLYEGVDVNINHTRGDASAEDRFGQITNPRPQKDGIYGDLAYLKSHPMAERICEAAERMPGAYGLSQIVLKGDYDLDRARGVVTKVRRVHSVDLVANPATTNGLSEGARTMATITFKDLVESQRKRFSASRWSWFEQLAEADMAGPLDSPMDAPAADVTPDQALASGFEAAIMAVVQDDTMDAAAKAKKIAALLKTHEKLTAEPDPGPAVTEEDAKTPPTDDKKKEDAAASTVGALCEALGMSAVQRKAFAGLTEQADRQTYLTEFKTAAAKLNGARPTPRSQERGAGGADDGERLHESQKVPADAKDLAEWLRD